MVSILELFQEDNMNKIMTPFKRQSREIKATVYFRESHLYYMTRMPEAHRLCQLTPANKAQDKTPQNTLF